MRSSLLLPSLALACVACGTEGALLAVIDTARGLPATAPDASIAVDAGVAVDSTLDAPPETTAAVDAARDAAVTGDADADALSDPDAADEAALDGRAPGDGALGAFSPPTLIETVDYPDANNTDPSITSDSHELYFISDRSGNQDIWVSRRDSADAAWGVPSAVAELNTPVAEQSPGVSYDGLTMWFARSLTPNQPQIWVTTRDSTAMPWSTPSVVTELNLPGTEISTKVDEDALILFFEWTRMGTSQIYSATRPNTQASWGTPAIIAGLGPAGAAADPFVAALGLKVWFALTQGGNQDLYSADRTSVTAAFAAPVPISELNTAASEADPALSPDFRYILFSSNRAGNTQIYQASR